MKKIIIACLICLSLTACIRSPEYKDSWSILKVLAGQSYESSQHLVLFGAVQRAKTPEKIKFSVKRVHDYFLVVEQALNQLPLQTTQAQNIRQEYLSAIELLKQAHHEMQQAITPQHIQAVKAKVAKADAMVLNANERLDQFASKEGLSLKECLVLAQCK